MQSLTIEGFQISPQQKRVCLLQEAEHNQPYRVTGMVVIEGEVDRDILKTACQKVVEKYEILRTNFQTLKGMTIPLQVVRDRAFITIDERDLPTNVSQYLNELSFDLEKGSVLSISLVKVDNKKDFLLMAMPAICADAVSLHNLVREIGISYTNCLQGKEFSDPPLQYADIAAWQNELFEEDAETPKEYWRKQDFSKLLDGKLPYEQHRDSLGFNPQFIAVDLNTNILVGQDNAKIRSLLMTCWQILLWRLTGHSEVAIAVRCDGRNYEELETTIGLLAKYLPVYVKLDANAKFNEIWQQIEQTIEEVEQWQESFNWEEVFQYQDKGQPISFFPFSFDFFNQPHHYVTESISLSIQKQYTCIDRFKLKLVCLYQNSSLTAELHYDANLFNREDIERLAAQFQTLLASAINNPEIAIAKLDILSPSERQQLLVEFNQTQADFPPYSSIHQWFEAQAQQTPNNIAVVFENQSLTYQELDTKANQLANHLISLGVKAEDIVALCVERSIDLIVGILGILKAGGAYLPLDPTLPSEALTFRIQDSQASILITQKHLINKLPQHQTPVVCIDSDIHLFSSSFPISSPQNLVYVIYTSGSTGKPKGVAVEHRQLLNYINGIIKQINLPKGSCFATISTFAADLGNTAIFAALCTGGCLHIISQERATNSEALADYCSRHSIDCLKIVPSHLNALLTYSHPEQILPKKCLIIGGEAASWNLINFVQKHAPECQIINHYGPTETTVGVLTFPVNSRLNSDKVPLGRPLANTQVYLLDSYQQPVPIGVPGEIYIGGDNVTRGYLNQPELTAEKFIKDNFSMLNSKLYKTGDLARFRPDGILEFLGRVDDQIKLHGFRIELGEIEATIRQHSEVRETVVLLREDEPSVQRLVAYIVSQVENDREKTLSVDNLRDFVRQKLPEYMVPANFVFLKALPLTSNGKIDRKSLPIPERLQPELRGDFVPPQNEVESTIASIWQELLHVEKVGIYDNFFDIGGHSLLLIQLHSKLREAFNKPIAVSDLFKHPTINALAKYISQQEDAQISAVSQSSARANLRKELRQKQLRKKH
ncbi:MAG TPA: amino acid adenylation domain-containing protein [Leptolyngbyaceae cyanobacterium]